MTGKRRVCGQSLPRSTKPPIPMGTSSEFEGPGVGPRSVKSSGLEIEMRHIVGFRKIISFKMGIKKYTKLFKKTKLIII
jgi:hypothetical protein